MTPRRLRWLVNSLGALAALAVQVLLWCAEYGFSPRRLQGDENRYLREAMAIWHGQPTEPGFMWPPFQKWFLAPLVGPLDGQLWLAQLVQLALLVLAALCLRQIWRKMDLRPLAGDLAFWLMLTSPAIMAFGFYLWPEALHMFLLLAAIWLLACQGRSVWAAALAGASIALALWTKSLLSGFWPLLLLLLVRWPLRRSYWRPAVAFVVVLAVVAGPGMWRGWQATGKPLIADSSVFNLNAGLHDQWRSDWIEPHLGPVMHQYFQSGDNPRQRKAAFEQRIRQGIAAQGGVGAVVEQRLGVAYFRLFNAKRTVVSMLPGPACAGYLGKYTLPTHWVWAVQGLTRAHYLFMLICAAFGLVLWRRPRMLFWVIMAFFGYQLALFLGLHVKARHSFPMLPFLCGFAASGLASPLLAATGSVAPQQANTRWRIGCAILLAALLVFLACGGPWLDHSCMKLT